MVAVSGKGGNEGEVFAPLCLPNTSLLLVVGRVGAGK
jgi:hypothetical protein